MSLTINFTGICCHMNKTESDETRKRTIVRDASAHGHVAFVEVPARDLDENENQDWRILRYNRAGAAYKRIEITNGMTGQRLEIDGLKPGVLHVSPSYNDRVPKLKAVEPDFGEVKGNYLADNPQKDDIALLFDLPAGWLVATTLENRITSFTPRRNWPDKVLAGFVTLDTALDTSPGVTLKFTPLGGNGAAKTLKLKPNATQVTIGNLTPLDLVGVEPPGGAPGHFFLYYDLAKVPPAERPVPPVTLGLSTGCTNTNWP